MKKKEECNDLTPNFGKYIYGISKIYNFITKFGVRLPYAKVSKQNYRAHFEEPAFQKNSRILKKRIVYIGIINVFMYINYM